MAHTMLRVTPLLPTAAHHVRLVALFRDVDDDSKPIRPTSGTASPVITRPYCFHALWAVVEYLTEGRVQPGDWIGPATAARVIHHIFQQPSLRALKAPSVPVAVPVPVPAPTSAQASGTTADTDARNALCSPAVLISPDGMLCDEEVQAHLRAVATTTAAAPASHALGTKPGTRGVLVLCPRLLGLGSSLASASDDLKDDLLWFFRQSAFAGLLGGVDSPYPQP